MPDLLDFAVREHCFDSLPASDWRVYRQVLDAFRRLGISWAIGGGVAYGCYASRSRYTKDLDVYLRPRDKGQAISTIHALGFIDYYDQVPYQRHWIYRGIRDGLILDLIWRMANDRADVTDSWLHRGPEVNVYGSRVRLVPPEEMIWLKLYVLQRERADWPDIWNMLAHMGARLDWDHLISRVGDDLPLLASVVQVFAWMAPSLALEWPPTIWESLGIPVPREESKIQRAALLDTREWFHVNKAGQQPPDVKQG